MNSSPISLRFYVKTATSDFSLSATAHFKHVKANVGSLGLGCHVIFTGELLYETIGDYYKLGMAFLSASESEPQGLTYLEVLACGVPLLCRRDDCLKNILIPRKTGFFFATEIEFVQNIFLLLGDNALPSTVKQDAVKKATEHGKRNLAKK